MGKSIHDSVLDAALAELATGTRLVVCSGEPANFAGIAAVALADVVLTAGLGSGDWGAAANGDTNGRKTRLAVQTGFNIDSSGTATHVSIDDGTDLLAVTTCTSQALTAGGTVSTPVIDWEFADPT